MKTTTALFGIALSMLLPTKIYAQAKDSVEISYQQKSEVVLVRMTRELSLTKKQTASVKQVLDERFRSLNTKSANRSAQISDENTKANAKLEKILTQEQFQKLTALRKDNSIVKAKFYHNNPSMKENDTDAELDF